MPSGVLRNFFWGGVARREILYKSIKYSGLIGTQGIVPKTVHTLRLQFTAHINSVHIE